MKRSFYAPILRYTPHKVGFGNIAYEVSVVGVIFNPKKFASSAERKVNLAYVISQAGIDIIIIFRQYRLIPGREIGVGAMGDCVLITCGEL